MSTTPSRHRLHRHDDIDVVDDVVHRQSDDDDDDDSDDADNDDNTHRCKMLDTKCE